MSRNLVLVTVDSLRADHCGFLGGGSLTPALDGMAQEGVSFRAAQSPGPRTPSAMPTIFTGRADQPTDAGIQQWQQRRQHIRDHLSRHPTVAERLSARGYTTVGITVNPWTQDTGFAAGFDQFTQIEAGLDNIENASRNTAFSLVERVMDRTPLGEQIGWQNMRDWFVRWTDFYSEIEAVLENAPEPFFLWVFLLDPHQPYISPSAFRAELSAAEMYYTAYEEWRRTNGNLDGSAERRLRAAYADTVRSVDGFFEHLQSDLPSETSVVVHADHGEAFGEHGTYGHEPELYQENLHVPLVVSNVERATSDESTTGDEPATVNSPVSVDEPVSLAAVPDMLCDLADDPGGFEPASYTTDRVVSRTEMGDKWAVFDGRWKYLFDSQAATAELYDTVSDPDEQRNLLDSNPDLAGPFEQWLDHHHAHQTEKRLIASGVGRLEGVGG